MTQLVKKWLGATTWNKLASIKFARTATRNTLLLQLLRWQRRELIALVEQNFANAKPGYKAGVLIVPVPPRNFFSGVVKIEQGMPLRAEFKARREGEAPSVSKSSPSTQLTATFPQGESRSLSMTQGHFGFRRHGRFRVGDR